MKIEVVRLGSLINESLDVINMYYINYIYSYYLQKFKLSHYPFIVINHIGEDFNEGVFPRTRYTNLGINIRYPVSENIDSLSESEKNNIRLNLMHEALLKLSAYDKRFSVEKLEEIKTAVIQSDFIVDIPYRIYVNKHNANITGTVIVNPKESEYLFYFVITDNGIETTRAFLESMSIQEFYGGRTHFHGAWQKDGSFFLVNSTSGEEFHF